MAWFGPSRCTGGNLPFPSDRANGIDPYLCSCPNLLFVNATNAAASAAAAEAAEANVAAPNYSFK